MKIRYLPIGVIVGLLLGAAVPVFGSDGPQDEPPDWRLTFGLGTTVVVGQYPRVEPFPGLAASLLVERGWLGVEVAGAVAPLAYCHEGENDLSCGAFYILSVAPRATFNPRSRWSPYLAVSLQLTYGERSTFGLSYVTWGDSVLVPAIGPRAGVRYRGARGGLYFEVGPSFFDSGIYVTDFYELWWIFQVSLGGTWSLPI